MRGLILDAQREAHLAIAELRDLARGIVPPLLADRGLVAASSRSRPATAWARRSTPRPTASLAPRVENAAYFVIAEALTNTAKHARPQRSWVRLRDEHRALPVVVGDDGCGGADPQRLGPGGPARARRGA